MSTRVLLDPHDPLVACDRCGYTTVHVARVITDSGVVIGKTLVCTSCRHHRRLEAEQRAEEMATAEASRLSADGEPSPGTE
ncbi:hypothetical protein [Amycolatopsis saalfeldensis]|uniref:Uncharacterized protein n=1 Tax=Amycolatopsis saalfeldensis TaxID=394193 RepID=A0A1H8XBV1_9PSEU|nr:hypothetical protein [Amycolatopsis saalfeldensis]SEP37386.1 hypothetical protein SAMN04489732_1073 [Amycolatopsis saalfeldensis]